MSGLPATLTEIRAALRDVWLITVVTPVRDGRPHPSRWASGLREIAGAVAVVFVALAATILLAVPLRQWDALALGPVTGVSLPLISVPLLLTGVGVSFSLVCTAALHTGWWLRIALLGLGASAVFFFSVQAWTNPALLWVSGGAYAALIGFALVRARASWAWWEFVVVTVLVGVAMLAPAASPQVGLAAMDLRPLALQGGLQALQVLAVPALLVAGSAPAQLVVTGAQAFATRPVPPVLFRAGGGLALVWLAGTVVAGAGSPELSWQAFAAAGAALVVVAALLAVWLRRTRLPAPPPPEAYPDFWGRWLYPLAIAIAALLALVLPVLIVRALLQVARVEGVTTGLDAVWNLVNDNNPGLLWRAAVGVVVLGIAWRLSGRGRVVEAAALGSFSALVLLDAAGLLPGLIFLHERSTAALGLLASLVAVGGGIAALARGRLDRGRAAAVLTVVLLAVLYPHRGLLSDPGSAVLVATGPVVLLFGLGWRVFTEAQFTDSSSPALPQPTRVLLYLANTLYATTTVAFVTLSRGLGTDLDSSVWGELGDSVLGDPLYVIGLVSGTWLALRPRPTAAR